MGSKTDKLLTFIKDALDNDQRDKLATLLGVSLATVGRVEGGKSPDPRVERALRAWCKDLPPVDEQPSTDTAA